MPQSTSRKMPPYKAALHYLWGIYCDSAGFDARPNPVHIRSHTLAFCYLVDTLKMMEMTPEERSHALEVLGFMKEQRHFHGQDMQGLSIERLLRELVSSLEADQASAAKS